MSELLTVAELDGIELLKAEISGAEHDGMDALASTSLLRKLIKVAEENERLTAELESESNDRLLWKLAASKAETENKRLRAAIEAHRFEKRTKAGRTSPIDEIFWEVLQ